MIPARGKIRQWFKKEKREENIVNGRAALESELKHYGISVAAVTGDATETGAGGYRPASGEASVDEALAGLGAGDPLTPEEEAAALGGDPPG